MFKDRDRTPVAQDIITVCTKCKMELNHVVVAQNSSGIVERVKCLTCGSEHKYRPGRERPVSTPARKVVRNKRAAVVRDFEKLIQRFKDKKPVPYSMSGAFKTDDVIEHNNFGEGVVISVSNDKMEVVFSDGARVLVCNRGSGQGPL